MYGETEQNDEDQQLQEETPAKPAKSVASHLTTIPHSAIQTT